MLTKIALYWKKIKIKASWHKVKRQQTCESVCAPLNGSAVFQEEKKQKTLKRHKRSWKRLM